MVVDRTYSTAKMIDGIGMMGGAIASIAWSVSGVMASPSHPMANDIFKAFPWLVIVSNAVSLIPGLVYIAKGKNPLDYSTGEISYRVLIYALQIGNAIETIEKSTGTPDLSTLFFRMAILSFLTVIPSIIKFMYARGSENHMSQKKRSELADSAVGEIILCLALGVANLALAYGQQGLGCGIIAAINGLGILAYVGSEKGRETLCKFFRSADAAGKAEQEQPQPLLDYSGHKA